MILLQKSFRLLEKVLQLHPAGFYSHLQTSSLSWLLFFFAATLSGLHGHLQTSSLSWLLSFLQPHFQAFMANFKSQAIHGSLVFVHPPALIAFFSSSKPLMASQMLPSQASFFMVWLPLWLCKLANAKSLCKLWLLLRQYVFMIDFFFESIRPTTTYIYIYIASPVCILRIYPAQHLATLHFRLCLFAAMCQNGMRMHLSCHLCFCNCKSSWARQGM